MQEVNNQFVTYELTEKEYQQATQFTDLQRAMLQNEYAAKAASRLALVFNPAAAHEFVQEEAYLKGQMELLESLLHSGTPEVAAPQ
jgi:hypothetical protein